MNSQTKKDIPCFRSYLPDALRLRFEDKLTIRAIAQRLGLSHSTIHTLFQRFIASGIAFDFRVCFYFCIVYVVSVVMMKTFPYGLSENRSCFHALHSFPLVLY